MRRIMSPNASASSGGMTVSRASRPTTSALVQPVTRSHARLKRTMRPSASSTQTSVCAVSTSAAPTSRSTVRSAITAASSCVLARRAPCHAPIGARLSSVDRYVPADDASRRPAGRRRADNGPFTRPGRALRSPVAAR
jgi:hypothetical protein